MEGKLRKCKQEHEHFASTLNEYSLVNKKLEMKSQREALSGVGVLQNFGGYSWK